MGWQCKNCLKVNSYRNRSCEVCQSPISRGEIEKVVLEEIRIQREKIFKFPLQSGRWLLKALDFCVERKKLFNIATGLILIVAIASNTALLKDVSISNTWEKAAMEEKLYILLPPKDIRRDYERGKTIFMNLATIRGDKPETIADNLHRAYKGKVIRDIHVKKPSPIKIKLMEEKLWKAIQLFS